MGVKTHENPWANISQAGTKFILDADRSQVAEFNNDVANECKFHIERRPEPFIGDLKASVVLLNLNPKYIKTDNTSQTDGDFTKLWCANILHKPAESPFYYLDPKLKKHDGSDWWRKRLGALMENFDERILAQRIFAIEFCAYPSECAHHEWPALAGNEYRDYLVESAITRGATIIVMQGAMRWYEAIPKLKRYKKTFELRNPQNATIKAANLYKPATEEEIDCIFASFET